MIFGFLAIVLILPAALVALSILFVRRHRAAGHWRWLGLAGILPLAWVTSRLILDLRADPTSHNLWPFETLFACLFGVLIMVVLWTIAYGTRKLRGVPASRATSDRRSGRSEPDPPTPHELR